MRLAAAVVATVVVVWLLCWWLMPPGETRPCMKGNRVSVYEP